MSKKYIFIEADTNDGDYISQKTPITESQIIEIKKILKITGPDWNNRDMDDEDELAEFIYADKLTEKQFDLMNSFVPYGEYGVHTLETVEILECKSEKLL